MRESGGENRFIIVTTGISSTPYSRLDAASTVMGMTLTTHKAQTATTPRDSATSSTVLDPTVESPTAQTPAPETRTTRTTTTSATPEQFTLPDACGPVSAAIRVTITASPDQPRIILSLVGQIERAIIATHDLLADEDLLLADRMLEGMHESLWSDVDHRWADDAELQEARSTVRSAMLEERTRAGR